MPINVTVFVNDRFIKEYQIGREEGGTEPDSVNKYRILEFEAGDDSSKLWSMGERFDHRYGDGIDICIQKGLNALLGEAPLWEPVQLSRNPGLSPEKTYVEPESGG